MAHIRKIIAVVLTVTIACSALFAVPAEAAGIIDRMYETKYGLVTKMLKEDEETMKAIKAFKRSVVFLSVSNGKKKAKVFMSQSFTLDTALSTVYEKAKSSGIVPKWVKLDVAVSAETMKYSDFIAAYSERRQDSMKSGIAFNDYYGTALLEAQLNSQGMVDYETGRLSLKKINEELKSMGKKTIKSIPSTLRLFKTQGYFTDNNSYAVKLTNGKNNNVGRRDIPVDIATLEMLADKSSEYLSSIIDKNGKFVYGYYPIDNEEITGYNILRHCGTTWNLILQYEMCRDESLIPVIKSALGYIGKSLQYKSKKTAFVVDGSKLNVGANGLAILAYAAYEEVFGTSEYTDVIEALAAGIIYMQQTDGSFVHTLHKKNYEVAEKYIIVYYDGEAAYGMLKAYAVTGKSKYLNSAKKAADYFCANDYTSLHSHWMAYVFNEITKYAPEERYFEFGLKNVDTDDYSTEIYNSKSGVNSAAETMNAALELYDRLVKGGYKCDYLSEFDAKQLVKTVLKRAEYGLCYFAFPEYAMYFKAPANVVNSFIIREDNFRIRIDDIQHFMDGYYLYWKNYDMIMYYKANPPEPPASALAEEDEETVETADDDTGDDGAADDGGDAADSESTEGEGAADDGGDAAGE